MLIEYKKEGMKITCPTGVIQLLTLEDLHRLWEEAKVREKEIEQYTSIIHDYVNEVEALQ